ncbi:alcohol dehydrogenase catalytic domain-containing protein [Actinomadura flavalba]|uniref:alcohol dehydrogenase catalytic domain-containing protein n=1 Tax=Actinomadura flavalba TaxID=1120938 RepID=UPI0003A4CB94|nr:alcohol dehydrogenase catalytic domain-containing protein [Actinomadura flavalba]
MRAAVIPEVGAAWELRELPTPEPAPGEVLVRVQASGVCHNDVLATRGVIPFPTADPAVPGHEPVGEVVAVGEGVTSRRVGDRVGVTWVRGTCGRCDYCSLGLPVTGTAAFLCAAPVTTGFSVQGGHAEYLTAAADQTVPIPAGLDPEVAAPLMCAGYTAWSALRAADPAPHARVAVLGIGGVGHLALQYAKACGFGTVAVTRSADKHDAARRLGADEVVSDGAGLRAAGGADVLLVTGPSHAAAGDAMAGLRPGGTMVLSGIDAAAPLQLPPAAVYPFFGLGQRIVGSTHDGPHLLREALAVAASGAVTPVVETFPKEKVSDAFTRVADGAARFRAVVTY